MIAKQKLIKYLTFCWYGLMGVVFVENGISAYISNASHKEYHFIGWPAILLGFLSLSASVYTAFGSKRILRMVCYFFFIVESLFYMMVIAAPPETKPIRDGLLLLYLLAGIFFSFISLRVLIKNL